MQLKLFVISNIWQNTWKKLSTLSVSTCPTLLPYCDASVRESRTRPWVTAEGLSSASRAQIRSVFLLCKAKKQWWSSNFQEIQDPENIWTGQWNSFCPTLRGFPPIHSLWGCLCDVWYLAAAMTKYFSGWHTIKPGGRKILDLCLLCLSFFF